LRDFPLQSADQAEEIKQKEVTQYQSAEQADSSDQGERQLIPLKVTARLRDGISKGSYYERYKRTKAQASTLRMKRALSSRSGRSRVRASLRRNTRKSGTEAKVSRNAHEG
jgi:hypothetical protein